MRIHEKLSRQYLIFWVTLVFLFAWLPLVRSIFDGGSYEWGTAHFGAAFRGAGLSGDLWYLLSKLAIGVLALYGTCRIWRPGLWLACAIVAIYFMDSLQGYLTDPAALIFRGDTLGIEINIGLVAVVLNALAVAAALVILLAWLRLPEFRPLSPGSRRALVVLAALLPVQFVLLRFGEPHGTTDQAGVILTLLQWLAVSWAISRKALGPKPSP